MSKNEEDQVVKTDETQNLSTDPDVGSDPDTQKTEKPEKGKKKVETTITDKEIDDAAKALGKEYAKMPKVRVKVKLVDGTKKDDPKNKVPIPVCINGFTWWIPRGEFKEVPQEVARILEEAEYI